MSFLPNDYEKPVSVSNYYKFQAGDNVFRILTPALVGWLDWDDKKPVRTPYQPEKSIDPKKPVKHFWAMVVWDYRDERIKILEITQASIRDFIYALSRDENWGDPTGYDLNVKKTGEKMETEYNVVPTPPKAIKVKIAEEFMNTYVNLEALWTNDDPFTQK